MEQQQQPPQQPKKQAPFNPFIVQNIRVSLEKPSVKNYLYLGFTLLAIIILTVFALKPAILTVFDLNFKLNLADKRSKQLTEKLEQLSKAQTAYNALRSDLPLIEEAMPADPELVPFIDQIRTAATAAGVIIKSMETSSAPLIASASAGVPQEVLVKAELEGTKETTNNFFKALETAPRTFSVREYSINAKNIEGSGVTTTELTVAIYYLK